MYTLWVMLKLYISKRYELYPHTMSLNAKFRIPMKAKAFQFGVIRMGIYIFLEIILNSLIMMCINSNIIELCKLKVTGGL